MVRRVSVLFLLLSLSLVLALPVAASGPGDLDTTFDTDGKVTTDFGGGGDVGYALAIQSDGKIVVAGYSNAGGTQQDFALARYNANGSLDTATPFGVGGKVTTDFPGGNDFGQSVAIQSDGKIVVAGFSNANGNQDFALARYNTNGGLDTSFGTAGTGRVLTGFGGGSSDFGQSVAIQSDGKIVVAGFSNANGGNDFALARYHGLSTTGAPGTLDTTFGTGGMVTTDFGGNDHGNSVAIQSDGKIVVAGAADIGGTYDFALARYNTDGSLDTTTPFGTAGTGMVTTDFGAGDGGWSGAIQSDGKIVVAGGSGSGGAGSFALARYHGLSTTGTPGTLDTSFGTLGKVTTGFSGGYGNSVAIQSDGKIVVVGSVVAGFGDFTVARYNANGTLDTSFDVDGKVTTDFGGPTDNSTSVAIQSDGKIVVSGLADMGMGGPYDFAVARYWPAAEPEPTPTATPVPPTPTATPVPPTPTPTLVPGVGWPGLLALAIGLAVLGFIAARRTARMNKPS